MIALVCSGEGIASGLASRLRCGRKYVDGPFASWSVRRHRDELALILETDPWPDAQYAAGRLAALRGARHLVHAGVATFWPRTQPIERGESLEWRSVDRVFDLRQAAPLQQALPDTVESCPEDWNPLLEGEGIPCESFIGLRQLGLATMGEPLTAPAVASRLHKRLGVCLFDIEAVGLVEAARDEAARCSILKWAARSVEPGFATPPRNIIWERRKDAQLTLLAERIADHALHLEPEEARHDTTRTGPRGDGES